MVVPKAPVDKDNLAVSWEDDVRTAQQGADVQAEPKAQPVRCAPDNLLRRRVTTMYAGHDLAALFLGEYVRHGASWILSP